VIDFPDLVDGIIEKVQKSGLNFMVIILTFALDRL
jgi:hypothetical protein